jgi:hypothetical protein
MRVLLRHDQVELAGAQAGQRCLGLLVDELEDERRMRARELLEGGDEQPAGRGLKGGHAHGARERLRILERRLGGLEPLQHLARVSGERAPGGRQHHAAPDRLEQGPARLGLQLRELLGDGRGRVAERVGNGGEAAAVLELDEQAQPAGIQHREATLINKSEISELFYTTTRAKLPA